MSNKPETRILKGYSWYGKPRFETHLGNGTYLLEGFSKLTRYAFPSPEEVFHLGIMPDDISMVDFEGGPDLMLTQTYYPGPGFDRKRTKYKFKITKFELQPHQEKDWTAVVIYTMRIQEIPYTRKMDT